MKKIKYYGIAGVNAYGVYNDYEEVKKSRKYIAAFKNKRFDNFEDAKKWAQETYEGLQPDYCWDYQIAEIRKMNWCYYRKKVE